MHDQLEARTLENQRIDQSSPKNEKCAKHLPGQSKSWSEQPEWVCRFCNRPETITHLNPGDSLQNQQSYKRVHQRQSQGRRLQSPQVWNRHEVLLWLVQSKIRAAEKQTWILLWSFLWESDLVAQKQQAEVGTPGKVKRGNQGVECRFDQLKEWELVNSEREQSEANSQWEKQGNEPAIVWRNLQEKRSWLLHGRLRQEAPTSESFRAVGKTGQPIHWARARVCVP